MAALDFSRGIQLGNAFKSGRIRNRLDDLVQGKERQKALFEDARNVKTRLQGGDIQGAMRVVDNRLNLIRQFNGDPSDTMEIKNLLDAGDIQGALAQLDIIEGLGVGAGLLSDPLDRQLKQAQLDRVTAGPTVKDPGVSVGATIHGRDENGNARVGNVIFDKKTRKSRVEWADGSSIAIEKLSPQEKSLLKIQELEARARIKGGEVSDKILRTERERIRLGYLKEGRDAKPAINDLNRILSAIDLLGTGKVEEFKLAIGPFVPGIDPTDPQAMQAILNKGVFPVLASFVGAISEGERDFAEKTVARLGNTPEANKIIITHMKRALQDKIDAKDQFLDWQRSGNREHELFEFTPLDAQPSALGGFKILSIGN